MVIKLRDDSKIPLKVLFYGKDKTGKSTRACQYCKAKGLKPIVLDFDETNATECPVIDLPMHTDTAAFNNIKQAIDDISKAPEYDTIILDNVMTALTRITPPKDSNKFFRGRTERWEIIMKKLRNSRLNVILIGQIDMYVEDPGREEKNNKTVVNLNAWVNEKYYCYKEDGQFKCVSETVRTFNSNVEVKKNG